MQQSLRTAAGLFCLLFVVTGVLYPLAVLLAATVFFPVQAHGSLIAAGDGTISGSALLGQDQKLPRYFQGRPSATPVSAYNGTNSGGSNLGPTNAALYQEIEERFRALRALGVTGPIPSDLVMASGSGLDPHISLESALVQVPAVARARNLTEDRVKELVLSEAVYPVIPFSGPYVNTGDLNRALDRAGAEV